MKRPIVSLLTSNLRSTSPRGPFQKIVEALTPSLILAGVEVDVIAVSSEPEGSSDLQRSGALVIELGKRRVSQSLLPLRSYLRERRPDVCIGMVAPLSTLLAFSADKETRTRTRLFSWEPTLLTIDLAELPIHVRRALPYLIRLGYPRLEAVLGVSEDCVTDILSFGISPTPRCAVVPNPLTPVPISTEPSIAPTRASSPLICTAGRLAEQKGHRYLLGALSILRDRGVKAEVAILGNGPMRSELHRMIVDCKLERFVHMPGHVNLNHWLRQADVYVHPSLWEGFGLSLLEAMSFGLPCVATTCPGGPKEILDFGKAGLLVKPADAVGLADSIQQLLYDDELRLDLSRASKQRAEEYRPQRVAGRLLSAVHLS